MRLGGGTLPTGEPPAAMMAMTPPTTSAAMHNNRTADLSRTCNGLATAFRLGLDAATPFGWLEPGWRRRALPSDHSPTRISSSTVAGTPIRKPPSKIANGSVGKLSSPLTKPKTAPPVRPATERPASKRHGIPGRTTPRSSHSPPDRCRFRTPGVAAESAPIPPAPVEDRLMGEDVGTVGRRLGVSRFSKPVCNHDAVPEAVYDRFGVD